MSSILKALRKLEEEKVARQGGSFDVARDVLRLPSRRPPGHRSFLPVGIFLGILLVGVSAFLISSHFAGKTVVEGMAASPAVASGPAERPTVVLPAVAPDEPTMSVTATTRPTKEPEVIEEVMPREIPAFPGGRAAIDIPKISGENAAPASQAISPDSAKAQGRPIVPAELPVPAPAQSLVVSGIAWQKDPEARLAIVNGLPVMVGTAIEGTVVEEILADSVRFSTAGRMFEVPLQK